MDQKQLEPKPDERPADVDSKAEWIARQVLSAPPLKIAKGKKGTNPKTPVPSERK